MTHANFAAENQVLKPEKYTSSDALQYNTSKKMLQDVLGSNPTIAKTETSSGNPEVNKMMKGVSIGGDYTPKGVPNGLDANSLRKGGSPVNEGSGTVNGGGEKNEPHPARSMDIKVDKKDVRPGDPVARAERVNPNDPRAKSAQELKPSDRVIKNDPKPGDPIAKSEKADPNDPQYKKAHELKPSEQIPRRDEQQTPKKESKPDTPPANSEKADDKIETKGKKAPEVKPTDKGEKNNSPEYPH